MVVTYGPSQSYRDNHICGVPDNTNVWDGFEGFIGWCFWVRTVSELSALTFRGVGGGRGEVVDALSNAHSFGF